RAVHSKAVTINGCSAPASSELPVGMWTIGLQPNAALPPFLATLKDGEMLASPTYPPATTATRKSLIILIEEEREAGAYAFPSSIPRDDQRAQHLNQKFSSSSGSPDIWPQIGNWLNKLT